MGAVELAEGQWVQGHIRISESNAQIENPELLTLTSAQNGPKLVQ